MMKNLIVLGAGESGIGAALLAKKYSWKVFVSDSDKICSKTVEIFKNNKIEYEELGHSAYKILEADLIIKSPGISNECKIVKQIKENKIPMISEIEFAFGYTNATIIGVTGTNGKTTTATLTHHMLSQAGIDVGLAGNVGRSFAKALVEDEHKVYVLEISSFQLDNIKKFHPKIAVITNLSPDHLDRYQNSFENYSNSKFKIIINQNNEDHFIYDADDAFLLKKVKEKEISPKQYPLRFSKKNKFINVNNISLNGRHNTKNAMAAATIAQIFNLSNSHIKKCLQTFKGVSHRLEHVINILKVEYINDSKATNVNSVFFALESINKPIVWIAGGLDKGNDYSSLIPLVREKVKALICLGESNQKLIDFFSPVVNVVIETISMSDAVKAAYSMASKGDAVLLSPACSSFDLFKNFEDRGNQFKSEVRKL